jgi:hypothetical protein
LPTETDWAYLAGIIDGEGCIGQRKNVKEGREYRYVRIDIGQKYPALLNWLFDTFEVGRVRTYIRKSRNNRVCFTWRIHGALACSYILKGVLPYLVIKREQAELAISLCEDTAPSEARLAQFDVLRHLKTKSPNV